MTPERSAFRPAFRVLLSVLSVFAAVLSAAPPAEAKRVTYAEHWELGATPEALAAAITRFEACQKGCKFFQPKVSKVVVLPYAKKDDDFYVWMFVEDTRDARWFSHVTVTRTPGHVRVTIQMVTSPLADKLAKESGRENDPAFDECTTWYDMEDLGGASGPPRTRLTFTSLVSLSGLAAAFGSGIAHDRQKAAAAAVHKNLATVKP
jgi:hypothetical protein